MQQFIRAEVRKWQKRLGLQHFRLKIEFTVDDQSHVAEAALDAEYRKATLFFNLNHLQTEEDARSAIIHELIHVVLAPLAVNAKVFAGTVGPVIIWLEESVVTHIEQWPLWDELE